MKEFRTIIAFFCVIMCLRSSGLYAGECSGLVYAMSDCVPYTCAAHLSSDRVRYEVIGKSGGSCKYSESDSTGFVLCSVTQDDFDIVSNYLMRLFTRNDNIDHEKIARLRASTCSFYRVLGNSFIKRQVELNKSDVRAIEKKAGMRMRMEQVEGIKSLFFSEKELNESGFQDVLTKR